MNHTFSIGRLISTVCLSSLVTLSAFAEDDLLSILDGKSESSTQQAATLQAQSPLRKLFANLSAEQNIFFQFFEKQDFEKSLYQWTAAFAGTDFNTSPNGIALHSFLLFKNNLPLTAVESLFSINDIKQVDPNLIQLWRQAVPENHNVWGKAILENWSQQWTDTFGLATEVRVRGRQTFKSDRLTLLKELLAKTQPGSQERAWVEWQLTIALIDSDFNKAPVALAHLMKLENNPVSLDLMSMTAARLLYEKGFLDAAIKYYEKIPKSSEYWFESHEEMGWAYIRKGEPQNSLAITKSLARKEFAAVVGPEAYFLRSLGLLKVCDYPNVIASLSEFQTQFKTRAARLMKVGESAETPEVMALLEKLKKGPVALNSLAGNAQGLPRYITRDHVLSQLLTLQVAFEAEAKQAGELFARSLSGGTAQVGYQADLDKFRMSVETRLQAAKSATMDRIKKLALEEVEEIKQVLQKMHVIEAEVLQQTMMAERTIQASQGKQVARLGTTGTEASDRLVFPSENEVWFDEIANYRVDVKNGCQAVKK